MSSQMKNRAKKRLGQHFLRDTGVIDRILRLIAPSPQDLVLEIGAGYGSLTERLAPKVARLLAVELDPDCLEPLQKVLQDYPNTSVVAGDALRLDLAEIVRQNRIDGQELRIVGNLPYNIATALIEKLLHSKTAAIEMVFMVQLEVAERIVARPGTKDYGYFSVLCQHLSSPRLAFTVSPGCFVPRPRVTSALITLAPHRKGQEDIYEDSLMKLIKAAFAFRRKTLQNALSRHPELGSVSESLLSCAAIDGSRRAEALSVEEFERMAGVLVGLGTG
jgi:16S rRNA (adenine1518-N6/adenine1519-N6)-dimethyltransferase